MSGWLQHSPKHAVAHQGQRCVAAKLRLEWSAPRLEPPRPEAGVVKKVRSVLCVHGVSVVPWLHPSHPQRPSAPALAPQAARLYLPRSDAGMEPQRRHGHRGGTSVLGLISRSFLLVLAILFASLSASAESSAPPAWHWTPFAANPVLAPGPSNSWDSSFIGTMSVVRVGRGFHLFYDAGASAAPRSRQIGHAISVDGVHWTKDGQNPILTPSPSSNDWDSGSLSQPFVLHEDELFKMWYASEAGGWGYAVSKDGIHFEKKGRFTSLATLEDICIVHDTQSKRYYAYYWDRRCEPMALFRAESPNETDFDLARAQNVQIKGLPYPPLHKFAHVFKERGHWYMAYSEFARPRCYFCWIGFASSSDGLEWRARNRRLLQAQDATVVRASTDLYLMYYRSYDASSSPARDVCLALYKGKLNDLFDLPDADDN